MAPAMAPAKPSCMNGLDLYMYVRKDLRVQKVWYLSNGEIKEYDIDSDEAGNFGRNGCPKSGEEFAFVQQTQSGPTLDMKTGQGLESVDPWLMSEGAIPTRFKQLKLSKKQVTGLYKGRSMTVWMHTVTP
jgi:hypothetical protein